MAFSSHFEPIFLMLTQASVDDLKAIWEKHSGEVISNQEAWEMATRLITLHEIAAELGSMDSGSQTPIAEPRKPCEESMIEVLGPRLARVRVARSRIKPRSR